VTKLLYKPVSLAASLLGGILAGAIFKQIWKLAAGEDEAPSATDADRSLTEVVLAAALQGALFGIIRALVDRGLAAAAGKLTGQWPGGKEQDSARQFNQLQPTGRVES
jgi:hypothetical protein